MSLFHYSSHDLRFASRRSQKWRPYSLKSCSNLSEYKSKQIATNSAWECMKMHVLPYPEEERRKHLRPSANATIQVGDAATQSLQGCISELSELSKLHRSLRHAPSPRGRRYVPINSSRLLSLYPCRAGKPRGSFFKRPRREGFSGRRTFSN